MQKKQSFITLRKITRRIFSIYWRILWLSVFFFDRNISKWFYKKNILESYSVTSNQIKKYLCVFSHYDPHNQIDPYVLYYLQELSRCDCDIIFVTTSKTLPLNELNKIKPYCKKMIVQENRGRDFGAFKSGIDEAGDLSKYNKLLLANDSVYGPFFDLTHILNYGDEKGLNMWGASDSWEHAYSREHAYHIQSYFVVFDKTIICSEAFKQFWQNVYFLGLRQSIVYLYEIGMSKYFSKHKYKLGAFCDYLAIKNDLLSGEKSLSLESETHKEIFSKAITGNYSRCQLIWQVRPFLNPTHFFWDVMIAFYHYPFIKRELVLHNPNRLNIIYWVELLKQYTNFHVEMITMNLERISCKREEQSS